MAPQEATKTLMDQLPDEILLDILKFAISGDGPADELDLDTGVQLSVVCRRFARVIQPLMYGRYDHYSLDSGTLFLRTLDQIPELGKALKSLVSLRPKGTLPEEDIETLADAIDALNLDGVQLLRSALVHFKLRWRVSDAQLALMMLKAPKLEELEICEWTDLYPYGAPFWLQVLRREGLPALRFLAVEWKLSLQEVLPLFKLPSLHTLELRRIENTPGDLTSMLKGLCHSSTLQSLRFIGCELPPSALAACIRSCTNLQTFQYRYDRCTQAYDLFHYFDETNTMEYWEALSMHKSTLRNLCLNWSLLETDIPLFKGSAAQLSGKSIFDFSEFSQLSYFDIPHDFIKLNSSFSITNTSLPKLLPRNIQALHINRADYYTEDKGELFALASIKKTSFPHLQQVHLENQDYSQKAEWATLETAFQSNKVDFKVERCPRW